MTFVLSLAMGPSLGLFPYRGMAQQPSIVGVVRAGAVVFCLRLSAVLWAAEHWAWLIAYTALISMSHRFVSYLPAFGMARDCTDRSWGA
jgi:hypothetical protein